MGVNSQAGFARRVVFALVCVLLLLFFAFTARALIGIEYQMQLGNPSYARADTNNHSHFLIQRTVEALDYNDSLGQPNWASWNLTASDIGAVDRSTFITDTNLPSNFYRVKSGDYDNSGYDRGHLCEAREELEQTITEIADDPEHDLGYFRAAIRSARKRLRATLSGSCCNR